MKVICFTEGGKRFGFGHTVRCAALLEAFEEQGIPSELIVNVDQTLSGVLDSMTITPCDWVNHRMKALSVVKQEDIVVIDSYFANLDFYKEASKAARIVVYLDDLNRLRCPKGIVLNSAIYAKEIDYAHDQDNTYLLGSQYVSLRKAFWDVSARRRGGPVKKVLITFGGMDFSGLIQKITNYLNDKFSFEINCLDSVVPKVNTNEFLQAIQQADLCISGGGQTIYNLARCGLPTIGVCLSENQRMNLKWWDQTKFLKYAGWHEEEGLPGKIGNIFGASDFCDFLSQGSCGREYVDGQGARRVVQAVLESIG